jgi:6-phosphogluconolactonase
MDPDNGALELASVAAGVQEPSFLALSPETNCLYAVNELKEHSATPDAATHGRDSGGRPSSIHPSPGVATRGRLSPAGAPAGVATPGGTVSAFTFDPESGEITPLNSQPSNGVAPCHMTVDQTGRFLLVANYGSGSVSILPILDDGRLDEASCVIQHAGRGKDPRRQAGPHAHSINLDPANRHALVADLGIDRVMVYRFDSIRGLLEPHDEPWIEVRPGAGPRHIAFHPSGHYCYLINELDSTMTAFEYDEEYGHLKELQNITTLPKDYSGISTCADVHLEPSGRFLYGSTGKETTQLCDWAKR